MPTNSDGYEPSDLAEELAQLKQVVSAQAERIEQLEAELGASDANEEDPDSSSVTNIDNWFSRRSLIQTLGIAGLAGYGTGRATADPQGQVGTGTNPLQSLYTEELNGGITDDQAVTSLLGAGLSVDGETLSASGAVNWEDTDGNDLLKPSGSATGIEATDVQTDTLTDNGSGQVTVGNSVDFDGNTLTDDQGDLTLGTAVDLDANDLVDGGTTIYDAANSEIENAVVDALTNFADGDRFGGYPIGLGADTDTDLSGNDLTDGATTIWDTANSQIPTDRLQHNSITVAGNTVSLGSSTAVDYVDLGDTGSSFPIPNGDLANSSVEVAGKSVSLGSSTGIAHADLSSIGAADHHTRPSAGDGLTDDSDTFNINVSDFSGTFLSDDGSGNLAADIGSGLENNGSDSIRTSGADIAGNVLSQGANPYSVDLNIGSGLTDNSGNLIIAGGGVGTSELDSQAVTPSEIDGSGGSADQVLTTDGSASGVSWSASSGKWADSNPDNSLLEPSGSETGIEVTDVNTDNLTDNGSGQVSLGNTLDLNGKNLTDGKGKVTLGTDIDLGASNALELNTDDAGGDYDRPSQGHLFFGMAGDDAGLIFGEEGPGGQNDGQLVIRTQDDGDEEILLQQHQSSGDGGVSTRFRIDEAGNSSVENGNLDLNGNDIKNPGSIDLFSLTSSTKRIDTDGAITVDQASFIKLLGSGGIDDNLETIKGGSDGDLVLLKIGGDDDITVEDGTGNIRLSGGLDKTLDFPNDRLLLSYDAEVGDWAQVAFSST